MIKKRDQIISHKFGTHMTKYVKYAKATDQVNWNNIWWHVALKEMKNSKLEFEVFDGTDKDIPAGHQNIYFHMIFNVNMGENFHGKSGMVGGGHKTFTLELFNYWYMVSRYTYKLCN